MAGECEPLLFVLARKWDGLFELCSSLPMGSAFATRLARTLKLPGIQDFHLLHGKGYENMEVDISKVDAIIDKYSLEQRWLITNLLAIQDEFQYLPRDAIRHVAERMNIPILQVYQVAEFYKVFKLEPPGKHLVSVCRGTACHVRGSEALIERMGDLLEIAPSRTTKDKQFTLDVVNCLGCCALGRVIVIDDHFYVNVTPNEVESILDKYVSNGD